MALSDEEKATLEALQAKANEPEADDFDIEIWDDSGAGARVPYSKGRKWLADKFGIDVPVPPATGAPAKPGGKQTAASADTGTTTPVPIRYFGPQRQGKAG
jgi:hypothetical protein